MKKKRHNSGETLVETLVAILLVTITSLLFVQLTVASARINGKAKDSDEAYETALSAAEQQQSAFASGTVTIGIDGLGIRNYAVDYYSYADPEAGAAGALISYAAKDGT